jgi:hypothetical protein
LLLNLLAIVNKVVGYRIQQCTTFSSQKNKLADDYLRFDEYFKFMCDRFFDGGRRGFADSVAVPPTQSAQFAALIEESVASAP